MHSKFDYYDKKKNKNEFDSDALQGYIWQAQKYGSNELWPGANLDRVNRRPDCFSFVPQSKNPCPPTLTEIYNEIMVLLNNADGGEGKFIGILRDLMAKISTFKEKDRYDAACNFLLQLRNLRNQQELRLLFRAEGIELPRIENPKQTRGQTRGPTPVPTPVPNPSILKIEAPIACDETLSGVYHQIEGLCKFDKFDEDGNRWVREYKRLIENSTLNSERIYNGVCHDYKELYKLAQLNTRDHGIRKNAYDKYFKTAYAYLEKHQKPEEQKRQELPPPSAAPGLPPSAAPPPPPKNGYIPQMNDKVVLFGLSNYPQLNDKTGTVNKVNMPDQKATVVIDGEEKIVKFKYLRKINKIEPVGEIVFRPEPIEIFGPFRPDSNDAKINYLTLTDATNEKLTDILGPDPTNYVFKFFGLNPMSSTYSDYTKAHKNFAFITHPDMKKRPDHLVKLGCSEDDINLLFRKNRALVAAISNEEGFNKYKEIMNNSGMNVSRKIALWSKFKQARDKETVRLGGKKTKTVRRKTPKRRDVKRGGSGRKTRRRK
jgi:hypothetical protein